jgi:hypothetical protein
MGKTIKTSNRGSPLSDAVPNPEPHVLKHSNLQRPVPLSCPCPPAAPACLLHNIWPVSTRYSGSVIRPAERCLLPAQKTGHCSFHTVRCKNKQTIIEHRGRVVGTPDSYWEVLCSNSGSKTGYTSGSVSWFSSVTRYKIRQKPLLSRPFPIH